VVGPRLSATGEYVPDDSSPDEYRLELWPSAAPSAVVELKRWPGYDFHVGPQE
jgi:hypothetical protein